MFLFVALGVLSDVFGLFRAASFVSVLPHVYSTVLTASCSVNNAD